MYNWNYMDKIHLDQYRQLAETNFSKEHKLEAIILNQATILPYRTIQNEAHLGGGVIDSSGAYIRESAQHIVGTEVDQGYPVEVCVQSSKKVMWFGIFHKHWGHFLTEMISRCWYLINHSPLEEDYYVAYSIKNDTTSEGLGGTYKEFINLLGVTDDRLILVIEPTTFEEVIIPPISCEAGKWYTQEYKDIFNCLAESVKTEEKYFDKVYLTRQGSRELSGTQIGEKQIQKIFKKNGYQIISPELLSLRKQIQVLSNCSDLVVVEGTLMHNLLFCQDNISITIINRVVGNNAYQPLINQAKAANITYIDAHLSFFPVFAGGPFLFYLSENLIDYLKKRNMTYPHRGEGILKLHLKLIWYFLYYLESMTGETIDRWNLVEKYDVGMLEQYRFYRNKLVSYNKRNIYRMRKAATIILKGLFNL